jgi:hypothetical protein
MKPLVLVGILLAGLGAVVVIRGLTYSKNKSVLEIGGLTASVEERRSVPTWLGVAAIVGGVGLILAGGAQKKS